MEPGRQHERRAALIQVALFDKIRRHFMRIGHRIFFTHDGREARKQFR